MSGVPPIERWRALPDRARVRRRFVGVDEKACPRDFATFVRYYPALRAIPGRHPMPSPPGFDQFEAFLRDKHERFAVSMRG